MGSAETKSYVGACGSDVIEEGEGETLLYADTARAYGGRGRLAKWRLVVEGLSSSCQARTSAE